MTRLDRTVDYLVRPGFARGCAVLSSIFVIIFALVFGLTWGLVRLYQDSPWWFVAIALSALAVAAVAHSSRRNR